MGWPALLFALPALAADTGALSAARRAELAKMPFFCETGRPPIANSSEALAVRPTADCRFNGALDTARDPRLLQPPFLRPTLKLEELKRWLKERGLNPVGSSRALDFSLPTGERLGAEVLPHGQLKDPLLKYGAFPRAWGREFVSISASRPAEMENFLRWALAGETGSLFWANPHVETESAVLPRLRGPRAHSPLPLLPRASSAADWVRLDLLLVGDHHRAADARYFRDLVRRHRFAWVAIEFSRDLQAPLDHFFASGEAADLEQVVGHLPKELAAEFRALFGELRARDTPVYFTDYAEPYFNFPYTNTSFHGLVLAARNRLWAESLPAHWMGTGALFAGLAHFTDIPAADFQDFAWERFPGLRMGLVDAEPSAN